VGLRPTGNVTPRRARYDGFRATIKAVGTGERGRRALSFAEARAAIAALLAGEVSPAQAGAFLIAMRLKGETPEELAGFAQGLRDAAAELRPPPGLRLVACAGAYDGVSEAPQLSLAAGAAAAACGVGVIVHCGTTLGPKFGVTAADVLAALGGPASPAPGESEAMLARAGLTLVHAAEALAGWRALAELRDEVGPRGPVHSAEKLVDWFGASRFVVGYTHHPYRDRLLEALALLGAREAVALRGLEGSDVVRPGRPIAHALDGPLDLPEELGFAIADVDGPEASAAVTRAVLAGEADRAVEVAVALSAGARLFAAGAAETPQRGARAARAAIADGRATAVLEAMVG
jgi:anthranilate phosphoribosyltransferase